MAARRFKPRARRSHAQTRAAASVAQISRSQRSSSAVVSQPLAMAPRPARWSSIATNDDTPVTVRELPSQSEHSGRGGDQGAAWSAEEAAAEPSPLGGSARRRGWSRVRTLDPARSRGRPARRSRGAAPRRPRPARAERPRSASTRSPDSISSSGDTVDGALEQISPTLVARASLPLATTRTAMSRSVRMPTRWSSSRPSVTTTAPTSESRIFSAASEAGESSCTPTIPHFMISRILLMTLAPCSLGSTES